MNNRKLKSQEIKLQEIAVLQALGIAELEEQNEAEVYFAESGEFADQLAEFQDTIAAISYSVEPASLSATVKSKLLNKINESTINAASEVAKFLYLPIEELKQLGQGLEWQDTSSRNIKKAVLQVDEDKRQIAFLVQAQPNTKFPLHMHSQGEEVLLLEGDLINEGKTYQVGDRFCSGGGSIHQPETINGCLALCITSMDDKLVDPQ